MRRTPRLRARAIGGSLLLVLTGVCLLRFPAEPLAFQEGTAREQGSTGLVPTIHPPVPVELSNMWLASARVPTTTPAAYADFVRGVRLLEDTGNAQAALPLVSAGALASTPAADYARYYTGLSLQRLDRLDEAQAAFATLAAKEIDGHLREDAAMRLGDVREARGDRAGALDAYETLLGRGRLSSPSAVLLKIGTLAEATSRTDRAIAVYRQIYREHPLTPEASQAEVAITRLHAWDLATPERLAEEWPRADMQFRARRWASARSAYERLQPLVDGAGRELVDLRLAAIDILSGNTREARTARETLRRLSSAEAPRGEEARFYLLGATRASGQADEYVRAARAFVAAYPTSAFAEEALNNLATHYIVADEDDEAEEVFAEMLRRFPTGRNAERAAWRAGWWAYRKNDYRRTIQFFEQGAAAAPRSDYRPAWLYWTARSYEALGDVEAATARYRVAAADYLNTYYGRLAMGRLTARGDAAPAANVKRLTPPAEPATALPTQDRITFLVSLGLWREAMNELQFAQKVWGDAPRLQATVALVQNRLGNLRLGINAMKRAYPQYMAAGGEELPREILEVLFPVNYWPLLQQQAAARGLDPFLVAALVAQESTFDPIIRSSANAIGLMQILPSTGRQYARRLGIPRFTALSLTDPEVNVRIGTLFFSELVSNFGGAHFALASYNAGASRVQAWKAERPDVPQDEFIDDIPFPETQNYVKRILGTAEDYRRLYDGVAPTLPANTAAPGRAAPTASRSAAPTRRATPKKAAPKRAAPRKAPTKKAPAKKPAATAARPR